MEHTSFDSDVELYKFHSGAPSEENYRLAVSELITRLNSKLNDTGLAPINLAQISRPTVRTTDKTQNLISAYSEALIQGARRNPKIIALDADLVLDTGLTKFKKELPDQFLECGIAEQDMASQAGGMALCGLLPVVHSFACFLSTRPNEQIYNNATERRRIIYIGSLAGILPAGPGHSHQSVRDISTMSAIPEMVVIEPSCEKEVTAIVDWAINSNNKSTYIRLYSPPIQIPYKLPTGYKPEIGVGLPLLKNGPVAIITYGPLMLSVAVRLAEKLKLEGKCDVQVINMPWLNHIDEEWLLSLVANLKALISIDNHYLIGGQGDRIADVLARKRVDVEFYRAGIDSIPACGTADEVLDAHSLSVDKLYERFSSVFNS